MLREKYSVRFTFDDKERIHCVESRPLRDFLDRGIEAIFARDVAKSTLRSALTAKEEEAMRDLINEIGSGPIPGVKKMRVSKQPTPELPAEPTAGYEVFLGRKDAFEKDLENVRIALANQQDKEQGSIFINRDRAT